MMKQAKLQEIHNSLINGQRRQMVDQINEYGLYDFFADYVNYIEDTYCTIHAKYSYFTDCVISYNRITNR